MRLRALISLALLWSSLALAGEADSPPAGVSLFFFRFAQVSLDGKFDGAGAGSNYDVHGRIDAATLQKYAPQTQRLYAELQSIDATLAKNLEFGRVDLAPDPSVQQRIFAVAHGFTDRLMVVGVLPYIEASVGLSGGYTGSDSVPNTATELARIAQARGSTSAAVLAQLLAQFPQLSGSVLQSLIVNEMGYKPIGSWSASGLGDLMVYGQYRFQEHSRFTQAMRFGGTAPTGRRDDPDNLLDIPFGNGYWALFAESVNDIALYRDKVTLSLQAKYDQPLLGRRTYRFYTDPRFPLSANRATLTYMPGSTVTLTSRVEWKIDDRYSVVGSYARSDRRADDIHGGPAGYDVAVLENESRQSADIFQAGGRFSTVELYRRQRFWLPLSAGAYYAQTLAGNNTPDYRAVVMDVSIFF